MKKIHLQNSQKDLPLSLKAVRFLVKEILQFLKSPHSEVSIYFVTTRKIRQLHEEFFNDSSTTDCISFPLDEDYLGEVFVCPKTAIDYAAVKKTDPFEETALYIIHGLLHCLGYDDLTPLLRRTMRKKEKSCMALIKKLDIRLHPR
ncbi:MAG TPA: rRNA maturation RNase YbeY [Chlamydiales bacterium]|jgi:probable rRNA maturation factor|nr:rRNA maturation RNase YbeY [Chlamydiales bacterium]